MRKLMSALAVLGMTMTTASAQQSPASPYFASGSNSPNGGYRHASGGCDSVCQAKCQATWQRGGLPNVQACYRKWSRLNANPDLARACEYKSREEQRRLGCGL